ncbi:MAG TPA: TlpA disulfide reductase family protein [Patescibacteria group bacterium]|nr:TlpA disulfide reductase family protein [Patescibacteria group bacterium]
MRRITLSFLVRWSAIATVAVGIGVIVGKSIPRRSPSVIAATPQLPAEQTAPSAHPTVLRFVKNPEAVPAFSVHSLSGQTLEPSEWKGKVVILNFWATWCTPCRYEIPELIALQKRFQGSLQVVGLSVDQAPAAQVSDFVKQIGFDYPVAMASEQLQDKFGGVLALPTSFVIDRDGRVVQKHVGLVPAGYYREEISYLAGKQVNARVETFVDQGQIFPSNVKNAKSLPGVDMSRLTPAQRKAALRQMNQQHCTCGCDYTLAQCRLLDPSCKTSQGEAQKVVDQIARGGSVATAAKAKTPPAATL